jgi:heme-degrading monooxygenase HmoA
MYARTTTISADPQRLHEGVADVRDNVMPAVAEMPGYTGLSMLCDRDSGRCIVTTGWQDEESMAASRDKVMQMRERAAQRFNSRDTEVQEWEIAVMHRMHETHNGACARVIRGRGDPARTDDMVDTFRMSMLPRVEELPGFVSMSLMVDRATGRNAAAISYDSRQSMAEAEAPGMALRQEFAGRMGTEITDVAAFDIALAHLRVPETA